MIPKIIYLDMIRLFFLNKEIYLSPPGNLKGSHSMTVLVSSALFSHYVLTLTGVSSVSRQSGINKCSDIFLSLLPTKT